MSTKHFLCLRSEHHTPAQNVGTIGDSRPSASHNTSGTGTSPANMSQSLSSCQPGSSSNNSSLAHLVNQSALSALNSSLLMGGMSRGSSPDASGVPAQQSSTPAQGQQFDCTLCNDNFNTCRIVLSVHLKCSYCPNRRIAFCVYISPKNYPRRLSISACDCTDVQDIQITLVHFW